MHENGTSAPYGMAMRDTRTGEVLFGSYSGRDTGRGMVGNVLPEERGIEAWASMPGGSEALGLHTAKGVVRPGAIPGTNQSIRWAADLTTQIVNGAGEVTPTIDDCRRGPRLLSRVGHRLGQDCGVTLVRVVDVTHRVLSDVSLSLPAARLAALAGRSGSGKSTLLHLMAGLMAPVKGEVTIAGEPAHLVNDWAKVSLLPQRAALAPELTVAENVLLPARLRGYEPDPELLPRLGLDALADRPAHDTSLGEQQRTALARALVLSPVVALLDEPTAHQDDDHVELVTTALTAAVAAGTLVVVATHDRRIIDLADELLPLRNGRV